MKSNSAIDVIRGYLMLLLSVLILGGFSRKPQGDSVSFDDSITPCKKEGYKKILVGNRYFHDPVWMQPVTRGIRLALAYREVDLQFFYVDTMNHSDARRMANKGDEATRVIGQRVSDVVMILDDIICQAGILIGTDNKRIFI